MSLIAEIRALARAVADETPARVPFTTVNQAVSHWSAGGGNLSQALDVTTAESTLWSALDLLSSTTAAVKWRGIRPTIGDAEPVVVPDAQSLMVKLWNRPNFFMTGRHLRTVCEWHHSAVGEAWMVVDYWDPLTRTLPRSWWPVRPDRMFPVPDPDKYLLGYLYVGPGGERIQLDLDEVLRITRPHPTDPHRGIGPVQSLLTALGTSVSAEQWISSFFRNDASPGGVIETGTPLEDEDYKTLRLRWNEQHRGARNAHRVAILEYGKWIPREANMRNMQFTEIRTLTRDQILEAFRIHKHKFGISEHVNLANATAAGPTYESDTLVPRLDQWAELANGPYRDLFGPAGLDVELEYDNPVPEDEAAEAADRGARVDDAIKLITVGFEPGPVLKELGLPDLPMGTPSGDGGGSPSGGQAVEGAVGHSAGTSSTDGSGDGSGDPPSTTAARALFLAQVIQKLYLGVQGNSLLTDEEGRQILIDAGLEIPAGPLPEGSGTAGDTVPVGVAAGVLPPPAPPPGGDQQPAAASTVDVTVDGGGDSGAA
jgi:HK97 family phage portal protein